ncbi:Protein kinase-like (PK-like) [Glarea lozoyensis ATCC 20868]|uniref:Altered inheritance of mitochondria protein 9, mitochondrial n=1 Tax=Glarea lozoyensis (strain ATCC 20868 / MF5171) TaxID=1116229 RepID=S3CHR6_GLAL2|nr:Protein kinase-like (PK-like) [Glarea lozoyensis ATCC 20868]EPE24799.1 Protein kinase-like (PK-like) [Glarea lozoyensis ATCC 20868]
MSERRVFFNVNELGRVAAEAVGANMCVGVEKYPDGMYNKSMLLTMDDGNEVVAKIPNPNAGLPHYTTASEVATMDFVRNILGTPVPRVLAWNSRVEGNPVGAQYTIMERVPGVELESVWPTMPIEDRLSIVKEIAGYQKTWASTSFTMYGSMYYAADLGSEYATNMTYTDGQGNEIETSRFAIGLSTGRELIDNKRSTVEFDRGPCKIICRFESTLLTYVQRSSLEDYHLAIGRREIASVKQLPQLPKSPITLCGPGTYQPTKDRKLKALECYLQLIKHLLSQDQSIGTSHLWHGDLHVANVFVNPSKPTEIVGIIDWQSTELAPLYFHTRQPQFLDFEGPQVEGLERPRLPKDIESMEEREQKRRRNLHMDQML